MATPFRRSNTARASLKYQKMQPVPIVGRQPDFSISTMANSELRFAAKSAAVCRSLVNHSENPKPDIGALIVSTHSTTGSNKYFAPPASAIMTAVPSICERSPSSMPMNENFEKPNRHSLSSAINIANTILARNISAMLLRIVRRLTSTKFITHPMSSDWSWLFTSRLRLPPAKPPRF